MPAKVKILLSVLALVSLAAASLFIFSSFTKPKPCSARVTSRSRSVALRIKDKEKWLVFINALGGCQNGYFTVFAPAQLSPLKASSILYEITDIAQVNSFKAGDGSVLCTYSLTVKDRENKAVVKIQLSATTGAKEKLHAAIFSTAFRLFRGEPYLKPDIYLLRFDSLDALGLEYETR